MSNRKNGNKAGRAAAVLTAVMLALTVTGCKEKVMSLIGRDRTESAGTAGTDAAQAAADGGAEGSTASAPAQDGLQDADSGAADKEMSDGAGSGTDGLTDESDAAQEPGADEGKVLNICCWDETLEETMRKHYPSYEDNGDGTGRIGSVEVHWIVAEDQDSYMDKLAEYLLRANDLSADERVDLFVASEDDLSIYVSGTYAQDVKGTLGLTDAELDDQYPFTQQMATDEDGILKAVSYKATPGVFIYRRSIARQVLGSDDPAVVQQAVAGWDEFMNTAAQMKKSGYYMLSGYYDAFSVFRSAAVRHWERDGILQIDSAFTQWVSFTKLMTANGYHHMTLVGDDTWVADQGPKGKVFGFFRSSDDIDTRMAAYSLANASLPPQEGNGIYGDYAVCMGPQAFSRGGMWILSAKGSDNLTLDAEIMRKLTCDSSVLQEIAQEENIFTNTVSGMKALAEGSAEDAFLGGQNPYAVYDEVCRKISMIAANPFDRRLGDAFRDTMFPYYLGEEDLEEAMDDYYEYVKIKYPELTVETPETEED